MGCFYSKSRSSSLKSSTEITDCRTYSWSNRTMDRCDLILEEKRNSTIIKFPGSVNGQQFIIQNCENCKIYVLDHCNMVTVDECSRCSIFLGPTKGSVFLRDCCDCFFVIASQQFRSRDCKHVDVYLYCATQPIIESCNDMRFGCYTGYYSDLAEHFRKAGLSIFNNNWSNIHDFTPAEGEQNWSRLPKGSSVENLFFECSEMPNIQFSAAPSRSLVPETLGHKREISSEMCFVIFFYDGSSRERALQFIEKMRQTNDVLVQTKECVLRAEDAQRIFGNETFSLILRRGPVIILVYSGDTCVQSCHNTTTRGMLLSQLVYISSQTSLAHSQLQMLFSSCDIQMSD